MTTEQQTIEQARAQAAASDTTAYMVWIKVSPRGKTVENITFHNNPGELMDYWYARLHEYGERARISGYVAL